MEAGSAGCRSRRTASSELVTERLSTAELEDDIAEAQREMEFAAVEAVDLFTDAVVAIALTLLALELPIAGGSCC